MKRIVKILLLNILSLLLFANCFAQTDTEFWFCVPQLTAQHEFDEPKFVITNADASENAIVKIEMPLESGFKQKDLVIQKPGQSDKSAGDSLIIEPGKQVTLNLKHYFTKDERVENGKTVKRDVPNIIESGLCGESCQILNKSFDIYSYSYKKKITQDSSIVFPPVPIKL